MKLNKKIIINNQGIGLVEAVLAIAFAVILVVALLSLTTLNVQNSLNVTERQKATKESSFVLEKLRQIKDNNFASFFEKFKNCGSNCQFSNEEYSEFTPCSESGNRTCFSITTDPSESVPIKEIKIEVVSYYEINKTILTTATETIFTNWRNRQ